MYFVFRRGLERILGPPVELDACKLDQSMVGLQSFGFMGQGGGPTIDMLAGRHPRSIKLCKGAYSDDAVEQGR